MLILHGHYRFRTRKYSCRNDYCTQCKRTTFTEGFRSFRMLHLFFIPLIPLGFFTDWRCTSCGNNPLGRRPLPRGLALTGFALFNLALIGVLFFIPWKASDTKTKWIMAAMLGGLVIITANSLVGKERARYMAIRKAVTPLRTDVCPYCTTPMVQLKTIRCEKCKITIL